jgi:hypothetical protein
MKQNFLTRLLTDDSDYTLGSFACFVRLSFGLNDVKTSIKRPNLKAMNVKYAQSYHPVILLMGA